MKKELNECRERLLEALSFMEDMLKDMKKMNRDCDDVILKSRFLDIESDIVEAERKLEDMNDE